MATVPYTAETADFLDGMVIRQYARYLCLQARYLEQRGDVEEARALRARAEAGLGQRARSR